MKVIAFFDKCVNGLMGLCLALMSILVFANVVLRYIFNSGIVWSEELSRFLFVWMSFLGAIVALKENQHLNADIVINKLPLPIKRLVYIIGKLMILYLLWLIFDGSWKVTASGLSSFAPATGIPLGYVYVIGVILSIGMAAIVMVQLYKAIFLGQLSTDLQINEELTGSDNGGER